MLVISVMKLFESLFFRDRGEIGWQSALDLLPNPFLSVSADYHPISPRSRKKRLKKFHYTNYKHYVKANAKTVLLVCSLYYANSYRRFFILLYFL